jgi:hypothetical protein
VINSFDSIITNTHKGNRMRSDFDKTEPTISLQSARWSQTLSMPGSSKINFPVKDGTFSKSFVALTEADGIEHGGNVAPDKKHLLNSSVYSHSAMAGTAVIADVAGYYPGLNMNAGGIYTLSGTVPQRHAQGWLMGMYLTNLVSTVAGSGQTTVYYNNHEGTTGRITSGVMTLPEAYNHYTRSMFLPMVAGDIGVQDCYRAQFDIAATGNATCSLILFRPLATIAIQQTSIASERDYVNQMPFLASIPDGACLHYFYLPSSAPAAGASLAGSLETVWG